jgi:hypothetical protein
MSKNSAALEPSCAASIADEKFVVYARCYALSALWGARSRAQIAL